MSENDQASPEVKKTTETTTTVASVPSHNDKREAMRTPNPAVVKETVTETETPVADDSSE